MKQTYLCKNLGAEGGRVYMWGLLVGDNGILSLCTYRNRVSNIFGDVAYVLGEVTTILIYHSHSCDHTFDPIY